MKRRSGITLVEVLVVISMICVLAALLIPAVQAVRGAAARLKSENNMKNIVLAIHDYASSHGGRLPAFNPQTAAYDEDPSVYALTLPYLEKNLGVLVSPLDPTGPAALEQTLTSYALNATIFVGAPALTTTFADGTSNTIALAEHYASCAGSGSSFQIFDTSPGFSRRATFADGWDAHPITQGNPPVSSSSYTPAPNVTFQVAPTAADCEGLFAQALQPSGMLIALADGSVKLLAPVVSPTAYWALVTPAGGEVFGLDW